jgi:hypothetical protein
MQEEGKTMARYLEGFSAATQRAQGAPNLTLIADVSLSTFTYYIAHGAKAHRYVTTTFAPCGPITGSGRVPTGLISSMSFITGAVAAKHVTDCDAVATKTQGVWAGPPAMPRELQQDSSHPWWGQH